MKFTRNLKYYLAINAVCTITYLISNNNSKPLLAFYLAIWLISFTVCYFTENRNRSRINLGLQYHVFTTVIMAIAISVSMITGMQSFNIIWNWIPIIALSVSLLIHYLFTRKTIKGIEPKSVFK